MKFVVPANQGEIYANFIRQLVITGGEAWKIIGCKIGSAHGLLSTSDFITDSLDMISRLAALELEPKKPIEGDFVSENFKAWELAEGLNSEYFHVSGEFRALCQPGHEEEELLVLYRKARGIYRSLDNEGFLRERYPHFPEIDAKGFTAFSTRHHKGIVKTYVEQHIGYDGVTIVCDDEKKANLAIRECVNTLNKISSLTDD